MIWSLSKGHIFYLPIPSSTTYLLQPNKRWWKKTHISHKVVYKSSSHYTKIEPGRENTREIRGSCYTLFLLKNVVLSTGSCQIFEVEANLNHTFPIMHQDPGYYTYLFVISREHIELQSGLFSIVGRFLKLLQKNLQNLTIFLQAIKVECVFSIFILVIK